MKRFLIAAVLLAAAGCMRAAELTPADEAALRGIADSSAKAIRTADWTSWASLFTEDGVMQPPNEKAVSGRAALALWGKKFPPVETVSFEDTKLTGDGTMAQMASRYVFKVTGVPIDTGKQLVTFKKQSDGKWLITAVMFNSDLPAPSAATLAKAAAPAPARTPPPRVAAKPASKAPASKSTVKTPAKTTTRTPGKTTSKTPPKKGGRPR